MTALAPYSTAQHDAQLQRWRDGSLPIESLLAMLVQWRGQQPAHTPAPRLNADLIEIGVRTGAFDCALSYLQATDVAGLPDYALPPLIRAARGTRRTDLQGAAVRTWKQRQPAAWEPAMREAQWLIDAVDTQAARIALNALAQRPDASSRAHRIEVLELEGALAEAQGEPLLALLRYRELLALEPDHAYARQFEIDTLARQRGATLALNQAQAWHLKDSAQVSALALARLKADTLAYRYRDALAQRDNEAGIERFAALDSVIANDDQMLQQLTQQLAQAPASDTAAWQSLIANVRADTLAALSARGHHDQVLRRYEAWRADLPPLPDHGLAAAAGAYTWVRRSDLAIPLYEQVIKNSGDDSLNDNSLSLVYAYVDTARFDDAEALLRRMAEDTPPYVRRAARRGQPNEDFEGLQTLRANIDLAMDQYPAGERQFNQLADNAPLNSEFQLGQARTSQLRERPHAALVMMERIRTDHPESTNVQLAYADMLLDHAEFAAAREQLESLEKLYPENGRVRRLRERYDLRVAARLEVRGGADKDGGTLANRERGLEMRLYSPIIGDNYRLFARHVRQHATLDATKPSMFRSGVGVLYERGPYWVQGEAHRESLRHHSGLEISAAWRISDPWRLRAHLDTFSLDTPWRARVQGVRMSAADMGVSWIPNEARRLDLNLSHGRFTDGNRRNDVTGVWHERWFIRPAWQLATTTELSTGHNERQSVSYFSPRTYHSEQLWARAQWLSWKLDQRRLVQVLEAGGGSYWQEGYGAHPLYGVRYSHEWELGRGISLFYGLSWIRRPYDGVGEIKRAVFFGLSAPLL
ncbi:poly-beta-1,6 N-acetyl-D-glucosamine export porin PgaA [Ottowia sp.]|uniref:poly-beta-1,6 N-acetyl-D-glucosamine export porin PgaA n=1 Tax=Ottowia sp. TaxID=1898956 RepID=UPI003A84C5A6